MSARDEMISDETYISVAEAAEILDITENAVRKRIHRNSLPAIKEGRDWRIRIADLAAELIIDIDPDVLSPGAGRPVSGQDSQRSAQMEDIAEADPLRDIPKGDDSQQDVPHRNEPADSGTETGLRLAEQQLAIFVAQFVRPKDERIAELERQLGRLEAESESLVQERENVRLLERENGQLTERVRQLEEDLHSPDEEQDHQRDTASWWQFWKWGV